MRSPTLLSLAAAVLVATTAHAETTGIDTDGDVPPSLEIVSPADGAIVPTALTVEVWADGGTDGIENVRLRIDDVFHPSLCTSEGTCLFEVELTPGEHTLTAELLPVWGGMLEQSVVVTATADAPASTGEATTGGGGGAPDDPDDDTAGTTGDGPGAEGDDGLAGRGCSIGSGTMGGPLAGLLGLLVLLRRRRED